MADGVGWVMWDLVKGVGLCTGSAGAAAGADEGEIAAPHARAIIRNVTVSRVSSS